jgi:hypothetical protein
MKRLATTGVRVPLQKTVQPLPQQERTYKCPYYKLKDNFVSNDGRNYTPF